MEPLFPDRFQQTEKPEEWMSRVIHKEPLSFNLLIPANRHILKILPDSPLHLTLFQARKKEYLLTTTKTLDLEPLLIILPMVLSRILQMPDLSPKQRMKP